MAYGDFKDLPRRTASDKALREKAFNIENQCGLASIVYKVFDKKYSGINTSGGVIKNDIMSNQCLSDSAQIAKISNRTRELGEELHKSTI